MPKSRVLELGCGVGANIPFFESLGVQHYSIDGSKMTVEWSHARFPALASRILVGGFTRELPLARAFDLELDRASLTHNSASNIEGGSSLLRDALRPGGLFTAGD